VRTQCVQGGKVVIVMCLSVLGRVLVKIDIAEHAEQCLAWEECKSVIGWIGKHAKTYL
jgi:hypothetical protein